MEYFEQARLTVDFRNRPRDWVAHLARDQMSAWVKAPRFAISDVENVALDAEDRMADGQRGAVSILLRIKMAECFIAFGDRKGRAGKILSLIHISLVLSRDSATLYVYMYNGHSSRVDSWAATTGERMQSSNILTYCDSAQLKYIAATDTLAVGCFDSNELIMFDGRTLVERWRVCLLYTSRCV